MTSNKSTPPFFMTSSERETVGSVMLISPAKAGNYDYMCEAMYIKHGRTFPANPISLWDLPIPMEDKLEIVAKMRVETGNLHNSAEYLLRSTYVNLDEYCVEDFVVGVDLEEMEEEKNEN